MRRNSGVPPAVPALTVALAAAALLAAAPPLQAQAGSGDGLDAIAAAVDSGEVDRARRLLASWREGPAASADLEQLRRADFLRARLASDADSARRTYARLAVEARGEVAGRARLRLAQLHLAEDEPRPALRQLELVRNDLPGERLAAESWLWTGRARLASGDTAEACSALRRAAEAGGRLREQAAGVTDGCGLEGTGPRVRIGAEDEAEAEDDASSADGWAVQLGAFGDRSAAERMRERARDAGWEARRLPPGDDGLHRVRVGSWSDRPAAEETARSLREDGFQVLVVEARSNEDES